MIDPESCRQLDFFIRVYLRNNHILAISKCISDLFKSLQNRLAIPVPRRVEKDERKSFAVDVFIKITEREFKNVRSVQAWNEGEAEHDERKNKPWAHFRDWNNFLSIKRWNIAVIVRQDFCSSKMRNKTGVICKTTM